MPQRISFVVPDENHNPPSMIFEKKLFSGIAIPVKPKTVFKTALPIDMSLIVLLSSVLSNRMSNRKMVWSNNRRSKLNSLLPTLSALIWTMSISILFVEVTPTPPKNKMLKGLYLFS